MTVCQHKSVFLDEDETKCRVCSQSLTYPPRAPGLEDERDRKRDTRISAGEGHRKLTPVEVEASPSAPLLLCYCCKELLPPENFYANNSQTARNRGYRAWRCRACTAFRLRVQRQQNPAGIKLRDQERRKRYLIALTPEQREQERKRARTSRKDNAAAVKRYQARKSGVPVLRQRQGRQPIYLKPVCRVFQTCPLRPYCTTENKGLG